MCVSKGIRLLFIAAKTKAYCWLKSNTKTILILKTFEVSKYPPFYDFHVFCFNYNSEHNGSILSQMIADIVRYCLTLG